VSQGLLLGIRAEGPRGATSEDDATPYWTETSMRKRLMVVTPVLPAVAALATDPVRPASSERVEWFNRSTLDPHPPSGDGSPGRVDRAPRVRYEGAEWRRS
jgi:hypothetical protein